MDFSYDTVLGDTGQLLTKGRQARRQGRGRLAYEWLHRAYELFRQEGNNQGSAYAAIEMAHNVQSFVPQGVTDIFRYRADGCMEAIGLFRESGNESGLAMALRLMSTCLPNADARALLERSLTICRRIGDAAGVARALEALGARMCIEGRQDAGMRHKLEAVVVARASGNEEAIADICVSVAISCDGSASERLAYFEEAHRLFRSRSEWGPLYQSLMLCAGLACDDADFRRKRVYLHEATAVCRKIEDLENDAPSVRLRADHAPTELLEAGGIGASGLAEASLRVDDCFVGKDPDAMIRFVRDLVGKTEDEECENAN
ncbi:MAG: hypothetical protein NTW96_24400 [Planctomycetia bacterium]|nr:hypothetical protein [Planctomycetia bacterium]